MLFKTSLYSRTWKCRRILFIYLLAYFDSLLQCLTFSTLSGSGFLHYLLRSISYLKFLALKYSTARIRVEKGVAVKEVKAPSAINSLSPLAFLVTRIRVTNTTQDQEHCGSLAHPSSNLFSRSPRWRNLATSSPRKPH